MIAITFALPAESSGVVGSLRERREENGIVYGKLASRDVAVFHTGVGRTACERSIATFLRSVKPEILISSGFAGSLTDQLNVGDLITADNFSDPSMAARWMEGIRKVNLLTVDSMVDSAAERHELAQRHAADAIDMETEIIARACLTFGVPMVSLRVISDSPTEPFPAPPNVLFDVARQKTDFGKLIMYVMMHPFAIGRLAQFAKRIARTRSVLTDALLEAAARLNSPLG
jgi:adenosylhomocysteine nucleosidase